MTLARKTSLLAAVAVLAGMTSLTACHHSGQSGDTLPGIASGGLYGSVPAESGTAHAGLLKLAEPAGMTPWILPIATAEANNIYTVNNFDYLMYRPLYSFVNGTRIEESRPESLAADPVWSRGDRTVTIKLKSGYRWSDGQPVTSRDVQFWYDEMKAAVAESPANWGYYVPGEGMPDAVASVTTPNAHTVVFSLKRVVNPTWFWQDELGVIQPIPWHSWARDSAGGRLLDFTVPSNARRIYGYLAKQSKSVSTYSTNALWHVVDGPYRLSSFNNTSDGYTMSPNTGYGGPHAAVMSPLQVQPFTSDAAEFDAVKAGAVDVGYVPTNDVEQAGTLASKYSVFGYPAYGWLGAFYNFKDDTGDFGNIIKQLYIRQALQHLVDQKGIIRAFLHGAGGVAYGTVGEYPETRYTPPDATADLYPYSIADAKNLLRSHGWSIVPGGTDACVRPGTARGECGPGIGKGTKLTWNIHYATGLAFVGDEINDFVSKARSIGIEITASSGSFSDLISDYNDVSNPSDDDKWAMNDFGGETDSTYPTTFGQFNSTGSSNIGGYSDAEADRLIENSVNNTNPSALEQELSYLSGDLPALFMPDPDWAGESGLIAVNKAISGIPSSFAEYSEFWLAPEFWYFK